MGRCPERLVMREKLRFVPCTGDDLARLGTGGARCSAAAQAVVQGVPGERLAPGRVTVAIEAGLPERLGLLLTIHGACLGSEPAACVSRAHHADVGSGHRLRQEEKKRREDDAGQRQRDLPDDEGDGASEQAACPDPLASLRHSRRTWRRACVSVRGGERGTEG